MKNTKNATIQMITDFINDSNNTLNCYFIFLENKDECMCVHNYVDVGIALDEIKDIVLENDQKLVNFLKVKRLDS